MYQRRPPHTQVLLLLCGHDVSFVPNLLLSDVHVFPVGQKQTEDTQSTGIMLQKRAAQTSGHLTVEQRQFNAGDVRLTWYQENLRYASYKMKSRIESSCDSVLFIINNSDAEIISSNRE